MWAAGRFSQVPTVLTSSGSSFVLRPSRLRPGDGRVQVPRVDHVVGQDVGPVVVEVELDLRDHLAGDLRAGAALGRLAVQDPRRVPVGDVDRERVDDLPVAVVARVLARRPELALGQRGQRPGRVDERHVAAHDVQRLSQVELDAVHPVHEQVVHRLEVGIEPQHRPRPQPPRALGRHGGDEPVGLDRAPAAVAVDHAGGLDPPVADVRGPRRSARRGSARPDGAAGRPRDRSTPRWSAR